MLCLMYNALYYRYTILQCLFGTAGGFLQAVMHILYHVKFIVLGSKPRSFITSNMYGARTVAHGTLLSSTTPLVVICTFVLLFTHLQLGGQHNLFIYSCVGVLYQQFVWLAPPCSATQHHSCLRIGSVHRLGCYRKGEGAEAMRRRS